MYKMTKCAADAVHTGKLHCVKSLESQQNWQIQDEHVQLTVMCAVTATKILYCLSLYHLESVSYKQF